MVPPEGPGVMARDSMLVLCADVWSDPTDEECVGCELDSGDSTYDIVKSSSSARSTCV